MSAVKAADMGNGLFPITYWVGGPATREAYRAIMDCGFTLAWGPDHWAQRNKFPPTIAAMEKENLAALDTAEELGLKLMIFDRRIMHSHEGSHPPESNMDKGWERRLEQAAKTYRRHPALWGYYIQDEPSAHMFPYLRKRQDVLLDADPGHVPYINLFPNYAAPHMEGGVLDQLGTPDYETHVREFLRVVKPWLVGYDFYPYLRDGTVRPSYHDNLEVVSRLAGKAGLPFWQTIQAMSYPLTYRLPTAAEMRFQVYATLAYGGKGISYYTLWSRGLRCGAVFSISGRPGRLYHVVRSLNRELKTLGSRLLDLTCQGVYRGDRQPPGRYVSNLSVEGNSNECIVGEFTNACGVPHAILTNGNVLSTLRVTLTFGKHIGRIYELDRHDGLEKLLAKSDRGAVRLTLSLAPGDGLVLVLRSTTPTTVATACSPKNCGNASAEKSTYEYD